MSQKLGSDLTYNLQILTSLPVGQTDMWGHNDLHMIRKQEVNRTTNHGPTSVVLSSGQELIDITIIVPRYTFEHFQAFSTS